MTHENLDLERRTLAALLAGVPAVARVVFVEEQLRPEHMYRPSHALILNEAAGLFDDDATIDAATLAARLARNATPDRLSAADRVAALAGEAWEVGGLREYCRELIRLAAWRQRDLATHALIAAVAGRDDQALEKALTLLANAERADDNRAATPAQATEEVLAHVEGKTVQARWQWPLASLNPFTHGGLRPGQVTLISGPTRHGKSVFLDQVLEHANTDRVRLYLNEMSYVERGMRCAARGAVIPHASVVNGTVNPDQAKRLMGWANAGGVRFAMQECDGWTAQDIARDARHRNLDIVAVDLLDELPLLPKMNRRETAEESMRVFKQLALAAGCHVLVVVHLNRNRSATQATIPAPALSDIRESGMLANRAHNVLFVWRKQDAVGNPLEEGEISVAKARQGHPGVAQVVFDGDRQRFLPDDREPDDRYGDDEIPDFRSAA